MAASLSVPFSRLHSDLTDVSTPHATADIADSAITSAKIADSAITIAKLGFSTWEKIAEVEVTSNSDYVEFTGLDINTDKFYVMLVSLKNPTSGGNFYYLYVEGDTTTTDYYNQILYAAGTNIYANQGNEPRFFNNEAGYTCDGIGIITLNGDGYLKAVSLYARNRGTDIRYSGCAVASTVTFSNITTIRIQSREAGGIAAGSKIILCKVKT